ncbi:MAG: hypothetical protein Q8P24_10270 [Desulfobacterales bacterium]|nr:hypothetical protein [Desulfobacterales bacterium]
MKIIKILDEDELYRRVPSFWLKEGGNVSSAAFQNTSGTDDMSVDLGKLTTPEVTASVMKGCGVASFKAGFARKNEQNVFHNHMIDNYAHSTVRGKKTNGIRKRLAKASIMVFTS